VLDPIGHWWSLRAGADGKPKGGYPVAVFGGMHGDLPLEPTAGKLLAQTAVESGQSMSSTCRRSTRTARCSGSRTSSLEELYKLKQATPTPLLLVLEEADEFAPQDTRRARTCRGWSARSNRISKRGRGRGIGMLYVTQRSAALNKNVLDQSDTLIVMRTIGPRDRAAIEGWVKHQDAAGMDEVLPSLPSLATGEAWVWTPERGLLERVKVRKARTFDSSQTPKPGEAAIVAT
jgi:DNA helicase HerA-like ATPase